MVRRRATVGLLALAVAGGGCEDMGLPGNVPIDEARTTPPPELVRAVMGTPEPETLRLILDGRLWVADGLPIVMAAAELRPIGSAAGETVHARAWDRPPYAAVFTRVAPPDPETATPGQTIEAAGGERWQPYAPVVGR